MKFTMKYHEIYYHEIPCLIKLLKSLAKMSTVIVLVYFAENSTLNV